MKRYTYVDIYHLFWGGTHDKKVSDDEEAMVKRAEQLYEKDGYSSRMACNKAVQEYYEAKGEPFSPYEVPLYSVEEVAVVYPESNPEQKIAITHINDMFIIKDATGIIVFIENGKIKYVPSKRMMEPEGVKK